VVARYSVEGEAYSPSWIQEKEDIITEVISTKSDRISNYVHQGWSVSAASTVLPWVSSRAAHTHQANQNGDWTTKRTTIQRLTIDVPVEDLVPAAGFETAVQAALGKPTTLEKFQALNKVFQLWQVTSIC
jgi:hypothetical protein